MKSWLMIALIGVGSNLAFAEGVVDTLPNLDEPTPQKMQKQRAPTNKTTKHLNTSKKPPHTEPSVPTVYTPPVIANTAVTERTERFGIVMVGLPSGRFTMGCQDGRDKECFDDEKPAHTVSLSAFEIGKTEVTQGQWKAVMGSNPSNFSSCGDTCPVENVSWDDVQTFIQKLNAQTGKTYRLPSEAEWEYACRAGKDTNYCGGNDVNAVAWYGAYSTPVGNSGKTTNPVKIRQPNAWGLYDMSGNVYEWVQDGKHSDYNGAPSDGSVWSGATGSRVLRGGSWFYVARNTRAAVRFYYTPTYRNDVVGFRLARTPQ